MNTEIKLAVAELKQALPGLTKVIGKSRTLPVLQTVRINRNQEGVVTLHATDLDSFITYTTRATQEGSPADVLVPVDQLTKATKCSSPKEDIGIVPESKDKVKIRYNIAGNVVDQTVSTCAVDEFPPAPKVDRPAIPLEPGFGIALRQALECCSNDASRYILRGACLDVSDKRYHYVVGTDGRMLFSANSFCFDLEKSVVIPDSKVLQWPDLLEDETATLSVEPGEEGQPSTDGKPAKEEKPGYIKLETPRWTFITREIMGKFPNWRQCVPYTSAKWTRIMLSEEALTRLLQVIPKLPGDDRPDYPVRLRIDTKQLMVEGQPKDQDVWTSIPVQNVTVTGDPVSICLNRHYLIQALRFGLDLVEIEDSLSPALFSNAGRKMVIMPLRMTDGPVTMKPAPTANQESPAPSPQPAPPVTPEVQTEERKTMPRTVKSTAAETTNVEKPAVEIQSSNNGNGSGSVIKSLVDHVDQIKEDLKRVIRDLSNVIDVVKQAEKEKRATEKEIDAIRTKLRQIQSVNI